MADAVGREFREKLARALFVESLAIARDLGDRRSISHSLTNLGSVAYEQAGPRLLKVHGIVEKPTPEEAPSTWGVMGRYVFTPDIFTSLERTKPGAGGEIQLTDAIAGLLPELDVYGYTFDEGRYDIGNKLDYLKATVELALARDDLGPAFREWLSGYVREQGIG